MGTPGNHPNLPPPASGAPSDWRDLALDLQMQVTSGVFENVLPGVLDQLTAHVGAIGACCVVLDGSLSSAAVVGSAGDAPCHPTMDEPIALAPETAQVLLADRRVRHLAPHEVPSFWAPPGARELLVVPLVTQDAVVGALVFGFGAPGATAPAAVALAGTLAMAAHHARLLRASTAAQGERDLALEAATAPMWVTDGGHRVRRANRAAQALAGGALAPLRVCRDALGGHGPDACRGSEVHWERVAAGGRAWAVVALPLRAGGAVYAALPWEGVENAARGDAHGAEGDLALAALVAAERPLSVLMASLAALGQDLARAPLGSAVSARMRDAWNAARSVGGLHNHALEYARRTGDGMEDCELRALVELAIGVARARARGPVDFTVAPGEALPVTADRGRLLEALVAMLTPDPGLAAPFAVRVRIAAGEEGVDVRVEGARRPGALAPPVVEAVAAEHGGVVLAEPHGALVLQLSWDAPVTVTPPPRDALAPEAPARARVLLVDDEEAIVRAFARVLSPHHDVVTATSVDDALARLAEGPDFDVVATDVIMPQRNGLDLYAAVAARWPHLVDRILFVTGGVFGAEADEFFRSVRNQVLRKPVDPALLRDTVSAIARRR